MSSPRMKLNSPSKPLAAEPVEPAPEHPRVLGLDQRDGGDHHRSHHRAGSGGHRRAANVARPQQDVLDLGRVNLLAADIDQFALAADDPDIVAVDLDLVVCVEPAIGVERARRAHYTTLAVWKVLLRFGHIRLQTSAALSGWCRIHFLS